MKILLLFTILSINLFSQEESNFFITTEGEKVIVYKNTLNKEYYKGNHYFDTDYLLSGYYFRYHNEDGKLITIKQSKIEKANLFGKKYVLKPIGSSFGFKRLHEIIIENDRYLLTQYYEGGIFYGYVFDKESNKYVEKKMRTSYKSKEDRKTFSKRIEPYFKDCQMFCILVKNNIKEDYKNYMSRPVNSMFNTTFGMQCN